MSDANQPAQVTALQAYEPQSKTGLINHATIIGADSTGDSERRAWPLVNTANQLSNCDSGVDPVLVAPHPNHNSQHKR
jgi:hypothetical protein